MISYSPLNYATSTLLYRSSVVFTRDCSPQLNRFFIFIFAVCVMSNHEKHKAGISRELEVVLRAAIVSPYTQRDGVPRFVFALFIDFILWLCIATFLLLPMQLFLSVTA